jgi:hypothetical protein
MDRCADKERRGTQVPTIHCQALIEIRFWCSGKLSSNGIALSAYGY